MSSLESSVAQLKADSEKSKTASGELKKTQVQLTEALKDKEMLLAKSKGLNKKIEELTAKISSLENSKMVSELL